MSAPAGYAGSGGWPGLRFDPAPGGPDSVAELADQLASTSSSLHGAREVLEAMRNRPDGWSGQAARAFTSKVGDLPTYLDGAHQSLDKATGVLRGWQCALRRLQVSARDLEAKAVAARQRLEAAASAADAARANPDLGLSGQHFDTDAALAQAQQRLDSAVAKVTEANQRLSTAQAGLDQLIRDGQRLSEEHRSGADRAAQGIRGAHQGLAPPEPSWFDKVGEWITDHAETIGDVAGVISAVAGSLALIPFLTPVAGPIALIAGGVALGAHALDMAAHDKWDDPNAWVTLAGDAFGMVPGVGAISKGAAAGIDGMRVADGVAASGGTVLEVAAGGAARGIGDAGQVFLAEAGGSADASTVFQRIGAATARTFGGDAEAIGKAQQAATNLGLQAPTVHNWIDPSPAMAETKNGFGWGTAGVNLAQASGHWREAGHGVVDVASSVGRFARLLR